MPRQVPEVGFPATLSHAFRAITRQFADSPALTSEHTTLSYGQLQRRAQAIALELKRRGVGHGDIVALALPRGADFIAASIGVLELGAVYLPLDPCYPAARLAFMLEDSAAHSVVCRGDLNLVEHHRSVIDLEGELESPQDWQHAEPAPDDAAYLLYTSGSTGTPKGTLVSHANVLNLFASVEELLPITASDRLVHLHSPSFGFSVWEIWGALLHGAHLLVVPHSMVGDPQEMLRFLSAQAATILSITPTAFKMLNWADQHAAETELALRYIVFSGEPVEEHSLQSWLERRGDSKPELRNMYAITETSGEVAHQAITAESLRSGRANSIGRPLPGVEIQLLDKNGAEAPDGAVGEMVISGRAVALGYWKRPELETNRFLGLNGPSSQRRYRTGDCARRMPDGSLEFVGRVDSQIKLHGHRIEPAEVESELARIPGVLDAAVALDRVGDARRLLAYLVLEGDGEPTHALLSRALEERLPVHARPRGYLVLDAMPRTPSGKLDRAALQPAIAVRWLLPEEGAASTSNAQHERELHAIWAELLQMPVGRNTNFFEAGGSSILVLALYDQLRARWPVPTSVVDLFEHPTIAKQAELIAGCPRAGARAAASERGLLRRKSRQQRLQLRESRHPTR